MQWVDALALRSLADLDARLTARYDYFGTLTRANQAVTPKTCREWLELHAQGYVPATSAEIHADDGAKGRCGTLEWLRHAQAAQYGWVRDISWSELPLAQLPAELATTESDEREHTVRAASSAQRSLADVDPTARPRRSSITNSSEVTERNNQSNILIRLEAWGDFNADHIDDVVTSIVNSTTQGSYTRTRLVIMTRTTPTGMLRVLQSR